MTNPFLARLRVWHGYTRAALLRLQGASVGPRVNLGSGFRCDKPSGVTIGERSVCEEFVWFKLVGQKSVVTIGSFVFVGRGSELDIADHICIGSHTLIAPGCFITDHGHGMDGDLRIDQQPTVSRRVTIGSDVWLGARVCVLPGVTIGDGAVIGAGAVVTSDIAPYTVAVGVPAREIRKRLSNDAACR